MIPVANNKAVVKQIKLILLSSKLRDIQ
jgi:hypothetical protein